MRNAILELPGRRSHNQQKGVLRAAIRQLERADVYLAAVGYMDLADPQVERAVARLRSDLESLRRYLAARRAARE